MNGIFNMCVIDQVYRVHIVYIETDQLCFIVFVFNCMLMPMVLIGYSIISDGFFSVKAPGNRSILMTLEDLKILSLILKSCSVLPSVSSLRKRKISLRVKLLLNVFFLIADRPSEGACLIIQFLFMSVTAMETEDMYREQGEEEAEKMEQEDNIVNSSIRINIMLILL